MKFLRRPFFRTPLVARKTENTDEAVISTISEHLNIMISEEDIDGSRRVWKFFPAKTKPKPVIMKFSRDNICHKVFAYKQKLKGKGITYYIWKIKEIALS